MVEATKTGDAYRTGVAGNNVAISTAGGLERLLYSYREAAKLLGISERALWELCRRGEIRMLRIGRSVRISRQALEDWIRAQEREAA